MKIRIIYFICSSVTQLFLFTESAIAQTETDNSTSTAVVTENDPGSGEAKTGTATATATATASATASATAKDINDEINYKGDRLSFALNTRGTYTDKKNENTEVSVCIPAAITLRGLGKKEDDLSLNVKLSQGDIKDCDNGQIVPKNEAINISKEELASNPFNRYGLTYGTLIVPYKYHSSGSKNFNSNTTVGPYFGYRFDQNSYGFGVKVVTFLGGTIIEVNREIDGENTTESLAGLSYGIGFLGTIKDEFQMGIVFGADRVSESSNYEDDGKLWIAAAIGFTFSD